MRKFKQYYYYTCPITEKRFKLTRDVKNTTDLVSIKGYYQLNPESDDRPEHIKKENEA